MVMSTKFYFWCRYVFLQEFHMWTTNNAFYDDKEFFLKSVEFHQKKCFCLALSIHAWKLQLILLSLIKFQTILYYLVVCGINIHRGGGGVLVSVNTSIRLKIGSRKSCRQEELFKSSDNIRNFVRECKWHWYRNFNCVNKVCLELFRVIHRYTSKWWPT